MEAKDLTIQGQVLKQLEESKKRSFLFFFSLPIGSTRSHANSLNMRFKKIQFLVVIVLYQLCTVIFSSNREKDE